jgi:hypothetical protein
MHVAWVMCDLRYSGAVVGGGWVFLQQASRQTRAGAPRVVKHGGMMCGEGRAAAAAADAAADWVKGVRGGVRAEAGRGGEQEGRRAAEQESVLMSCGCNNCFAG